MEEQNHAPNPEQASLSKAQIGVPFESSDVVHSNELRASTPSPRKSVKLPKSSRRMIYPCKNSLTKSIKRAEQSALTIKNARDPEVQHIPQELFESANRSQLLRYLADRESSRVFEAVINALRKEALLLEPSAISLQVLGRLAFRLDNRVDFYAQLLETTNAVIVECVQDSRAGRDSGFSIPGEVQLLGSRDRAQEACRRFNCLPDHERKIVYAVLIQRATRESVAMEHNISSLLLEEIVNRCISNVCGSPPDSAPIVESQL